MKHHNFRQRLQMVEVLNVMMWKKATWSLHCFSHRKTSAIKHAWSSTSCSKSKTHIWQVPTVLCDLSAEGRMGKKYLITGDCQLWETDLRVKNITHTHNQVEAIVYYISFCQGRPSSDPSNRQRNSTHNPTALFEISPQFSFYPALQVLLTKMKGQHLP